MNSNMLKRLVARTALVLSAILSIAVISHAQGQHTLQGKVHYPNGAPPSHPVRVSLTFSGMPVYETFTDLSGRFSFTGLRRGMYQLTAEGDDQTFETTRVNAEISAYGNAPQSFTQNIQLRLKTGKAVPAASVLSADLADPNLPAGARQEYEKGVRDARDNKAEKAITHFKEAVTLYPTFYIAQVALAEQYSKLKRDSDAVTTYEEAIKTKPDRAAAYVGLGSLFVKQKK